MVGFELKETQSWNIRVAIINQLNKGIIDKKVIFTKVVEELNVPRPSVRRCSRELVKDMLYKIKILSSELDPVKNN